MGRNVRQKKKVNNIKNRENIKRDFERDLKQKQPKRDNTKRGRQSKRRKERKEQRS